MQASPRVPVAVLFTGFRLDLRAGELQSEGGKTVRLPDQPFRILKTLLDNPGEVVTREELRKCLWPNDTIVEFEHSISAAMNRLRQALSDSAEQSRFIETLARRGYRFMVPVEFEEPPASAPSLAEASSTKAISRIIHGLGKGVGSQDLKTVTHVLLHCGMQRVVDRVPAAFEPELQRSQP